MNKEAKVYIEANEVLDTTNYISFRSHPLYIIVGNVDEIENFMWFGRNDDRNILSNTLKNEIIPYAIENSLI